jgi:hypothetical protein
VAAEDVTSKALIMLVVKHIADVDSDGESIAKVKIRSQIDKAV